MASTVSKLAREAAVACRRGASPTAVGGGKPPVSPICGPVPPGRFYPAGRRMCSDAGLKNGSEKDGPKPPDSAAAPAAAAASKIVVDRTTDRLVSAETLESDETTWALYERWCKYHSKPCDLARFRPFMRTAQLVRKVNSSGVRYKLALNQSSDRTREEVERTYCCNDAGTGVRQRRHQHLPPDVEISGPESEGDAIAGAAATVDPRADLLVGAETLESEETLWALYERWSKWHSRSPTAETERRFKKKADELLRHLNDSGDPDRLFPFRNMTRGEFRTNCRSYC